MRNTLENLSKNTGDDFKLSDNFKNAITLPEKVTPPINTVKEVINIKTVSYTHLRAHETRNDI